MKNRQRIISIRANALNEADRLELAQLLIKAGYIVKMGVDKLSNGRSVYYVEYWIES